MVKQSKQASPQVDTGHPLLRNPRQVDELLERAQGRKDIKEFQIQELDDWKKAVNGMASTPNGQLFLKYMVQFSQIFNGQAPVRDAAEHRVRAAFYLTWVRPFLTPEQRGAIE